MMRKNHPIVVRGRTRLDASVAPGALRALRCMRSWTCLPLPRVPALKNRLPSVRPGHNDRAAGLSLLRPYLRLALARSWEQRVVVIAMQRITSEFYERYLAALGALFQVLALRVRPGLVRLGRMTLDSTRIRANASGAVSRVTEGRDGGYGETFDCHAVVDATGHVAQHTTTVTADTPALPPLVAQIKTNTGRRAEELRYCSEGNLAVSSRHHIRSAAASQPAEVGITGPRQPFDASPREAGGLWRWRRALSAAAQSLPLAQTSRRARSSATSNTRAASSSPGSGARGAWQRFAAHGRWPARRTTLEAAGRDTMSALLTVPRRPRSGAVDAIGTSRRCRLSSPRHPPLTAPLARPDPSQPARSSKALLLAAIMIAQPVRGGATTYYVRQTVGNDARDGTSPEAAWQHISRLTDAMHAGDIAYVGPGLYRDQIMVVHDGTSAQRLTFIADTTGQHTGDPPGVVMITGAEPVDESIFVPEDHPGVYKAHFPHYPVLGVVEMDGNQIRYWHIKSRKELPLPEGKSELDLVAERPSSYFYDESTKVLSIHTSDGKAPTTHEIELFRRLNGIYTVGMHHITVMGFTFRHMGDAGISFFQGAGDGIAINNTSYGSRQGIRVYTANNILVYGNTLFRNENSGVYFVGQSTNAQAIGNIAYENVKGIRWGSRSVNGLALDNVLFDNLERGLSIEDMDHVFVRGNRLVNNATSQLMILQSDYDSEDNCFASRGPDQWAADFYIVDHYKTLAEYQQAKRQDLHSRGDDCGPPPAKLDVRKLHAETMAYAERARKILRGEIEGGGEGTTPALEPVGRIRAWLAKMLGG